MDAREELKRWIAVVIELSSEEESPPGWALAGMASQKMAASIAIKTGKSQNVNFRRIDRFSLLLVGCLHSFIGICGPSNSGPKAQPNHPSP